MFGALVEGEAARLEIWGGRIVNNGYEDWGGGGGQQREEGGGKGGEAENKIL